MVLFFRSPDFSLSGNFKVSIENGVEDTMLHYYCGVEDDEDATLHQEFIVTINNGEPATVFPCEEGSGYPTVVAVPQDRSHGGKGIEFLVSRCEMRLYTYIESVSYDRVTGFDIRVEKILPCTEKEYLEAQEEYQEWKRNAFKEELHALFTKANDKCLYRKHLSTRIKRLFTKYFGHERPLFTLKELGFGE